MAAPFSQILSNIQSGDTTLKSVATRLIDIVEEIHNHNLLVVDIKPDNFMLNNNGELVILDFGLFQSFKNISGHRPDDGAKLAGTPLYVSINLHDGHTPSRRDDLESVLYMLMELVLNLAEKDLPWRFGRSEEDVEDKKKSAIEDEQFWKSLGSCKTTLRNSFEYVTDLDYSQKPDYNKLRTMLSKLPLLGKKSRSSTRKTTSSSRKTASSVRKRPPSKVPSRRATKRQEVIYIDSDDEGDAEADDDDDDGFYSVQEEEDDFHTCQDTDEVVNMDFEVLSEEEYDKKQKSNKKAGIGVTLKIIAGPYQGEIISLVKGEKESIEFGTSPGSDGFNLAKDSKVDQTHISMQLQVTRKLTTVLVKSMSSNGAFVGRENIPKGKSKKIFINDVVTVGNTEIKVVPLALATYKEEEADFDSDVEMEDMDTAEEKATEKDKGKSTVTFVFSDGNGEPFELYKGDNDYLILGSKPKDSNSIVIPNADAEHVKLTVQMHRSKKFPVVTVKDLSSSGTFIDGQTVKKEGKLFVGSELKLGDSVSLKVKRTPFSEVNHEVADEAEKKSSSTNGGKNRGFLLDITEGPHQGETIKLLNTEGNNMLVIGANPRPRNGFGFRLNREKAVTAASHFRIELDASKKSFCKACITDLKARGEGAKVNGDKLEKGKNRTVFVNDTITIGESVIKIKPLS